MKTFMKPTTKMSLIAAAITILILSACSKDKTEIPRNRTNGAPNTAPAAGGKQSKKTTKDSDQDPDSSSSSAKLEVTEDYLGKNLILKAAEGDVGQGFIILSRESGGDSKSDPWALYKGLGVTPSAVQDAGPIDSNLREFKKHYKREGKNYSGYAEIVGKKNKKDVYQYSVVLPFNYKTGQFSQEASIKADATKSTILKDNNNEAYAGTHVEIDPRSNGTSGKIKLTGEDAKRLHGALAGIDSLIQCDSEDSCVVNINFKTGEVVQP